MWTPFVSEQERTRFEARAASGEFKREPSGAAARTISEKGLAE